MNKTQLTNQNYLINSQYKDASNLDARVRLHKHFSTNKYDWPLWVFDQINPPTGSNILEIGCGPAHLWHNNLDRLAEDWTITLSDFSPGMLDAARENLSQHQHKFRFERVDAQAIPFSDHDFDVVIANHMLYHIPDRPKAFAEIRRVLKRGGRFFAATNGTTHLQELHQLLNEFDADISQTSTFWAIAFGLENGQDQMAPWFDHITLHHYPDALVVTQPEPLVEYYLSAFESLRTKQAALRTFIKQKLKDEGAIHITKSSGLFAAW